MTHHITWPNQSQMTPSIDSPRPRSPPDHSCHSVVTSQALVILWQPSVWSLGMMMRNHQMSLLLKSLLSLRVNLSKTGWWGANPGRVRTWEGSIQLRWRTNSGFCHEQIKRIYKHCLRCCRKCNNIISVSFYSTFLRTLPQIPNPRWDDSRDYSNIRRLLNADHLTIKTKRNARKSDFTLSNARKSLALLLV